MSVGEFVLVATAAVPVLFASHECIRLYAFHRAAEVLLLQHLAKASLSSLAHIENETFRPPVGQENSIERDLKRHFNVLSQVPALKWQWSSQAEESSFRSLLGVRVSVLGPSRTEPLQPVQAHVTLCVRSWLEPLLRITRDGRSCVGEYLPESEGSQATGRGIALKLSATRVVPMNVHVFHYGVYRHEQPPRFEK